MKARLSVLALLSVVVSLVPSAQAGKPVQLDEVKSWERAGNRWAIGRGADREPLMIMDLSFPWILDRALLFRAGKAGEHILSQLRDIASESDQLKSSPLLKILLQEQHRSRSAEKKLASDELWNQEIPWKKDRAAQVFGENDSRLLSDIDWGRWSKNPSRFQKAWAKLARGVLIASGERAFSEQLTDAAAAEFLLSAIEIKRVEKGGIEVSWAPSQRLAARVPGKKVIDFRCEKCAMWEMLGWDTLDNGIDVAVSFIPIPAVANLLGTAFDRLFHYREEVYRLHWAFLQELLDAAERGDRNPVSPFSGLSPAEREKAAKELQLADTTLSSVVRWLWSRPAKAWRSAMARDQERSDRAAHWLREHSHAVDLIHPHFAKATHLLGDQWLFSLAAYRAFPTITPPVIAVDYQKPDYLTIRRLALDSATGVVQFSSRFIPWAGTLIRMAWMAAVEVPYRVLQHREARLESLLEQRIQQHPEEDWRMEIQVLESQRINPFVFRRDSMLRKTEERWALLPH